MFNWPETSALYAGAQEIPRPKEVAPSAFSMIPAQPTHQALQSLIKALQAQAGFCLAQDSRPSNIHAPVGDFLTLTGGTSGHPKVIARSQASWIASFDVNAALFDYQSADSIAVLGQLSHSLALYGVLEALHLGMDAHALDMLRPPAQRARIAAQKISILYATPTQLRLLAMGPRDTPLLDVRLILCGGGRLDRATREAIARACPNAALHQFYGAAETSFITLSDADTPLGSVGKPYPGVDLQIREGEVWVQSQYLFKGYALGGARDTRWEGDYLSVGEMGDLDENGNLWLRGRKTRMITVADQNVFPEEIETFLSGLGHVAACAVLARPDPVRGNRLVAILQGRHDPAQAEDVKTQCRARFGTMAAPHRVLFHPELPLLTSGKIDLKALAIWLEQQP